MCGGVFSHLLSYWHIPKNNVAYSIYQPERADYSAYLQLI